MRLTRLFTLTFDELLKPMGYKRKGRCYTRLDGEILKGIVIKPINPYSIHFYAAPFWFPQTGCMEQASLAKGYWAEAGFEVSPGLESYYREENEQLNLDFMNMSLQTTTKYILPYFEKIVDIDSYIALSTPQWSPPGISMYYNYTYKIDTKAINESFAYLNSSVTVFWNRITNLLQYACLYKAYEERDFEASYNRLLEKASFRNDPRFLSYLTSKYAEVMASGDLEWIERFKRERSALIKPRLREELGLDTFHLQ